MIRLPLACVCVLALGLMGPARAHAQIDTLAYSPRAASWVGHFTILSANSLLSGLTAGVFQEVRGGSFKDGFMNGALGGAMIYTGKRVAADRFFGAGLIGREVSAVGASVVRNASAGIGAFDRLILPVGFTRIYWNRAAGEVSLKLDVVSVGYTLQAIMEDELYFEADKSLSAGMPVFRTDNKLITYASGDHHAAGAAQGGIVLRAHIPAYQDEFLDRVFAHERIHILQEDQVFTTLNDHADDWVLSKLGPVAPVSRYIDINLSTELILLLARWIPRHGDRPWEMEPNYLTR